MSTFTALNGGSPKASEGPSINVNTDRLQQGLSPVEDQPSSASDVAPQQPHQPRATQAPREAQATQASQAPQAPQSAISQNESWSTHSSERPATYQPARYPDVEGSHKRKRSESAEPRREPPSQERTPETTPHPTHGEARGHSFNTPSREHRQYAEEQRDRESWYGYQSRDERYPYDSQQNSASSSRGPTEEQIGETLLQANNQMDQGDYPNTSPDTEDRSITVYGGSYDRHDSVLQHDPKKRKRNFSNRTKTGCLTCRRRKKKCDEQKPECENCVKGGFVCLGYPAQRGPGWHKPENKSPAVPLESKDPTYVPPGAYGMPQPQPQPQPQQSVYGTQPSKREPLPGYRGQALRIDPPQGRPLATDDDRPTASTMPSASVASPENKLSALTYTPANAFPTPVSANTQPPAFGDKMPPKEYQRVPVLHDFSRSEPETPHPSTQLPQINILHPTRGSSPAAPGPPPPPPPQTSNAQAAAQMALTHTQFPSRRTQKEEMLSGRHYYPFDKELCLERERCAAACWRFNSLTSPPTIGVSSEERARLFLEILQPRDPVRISPNEASPVTNVGRVGRHVAVETPFICDYGYNIVIGNQVAIGRNCTINDVCEVKIGDNCVIGPNVNIFTATLPIDPKKRQGGQGPQLGRPIVIGPDCWIGGGATILPGRTIGKGCTVGAGSVVTKDVPPFTIVAGNPAHVLRGIAT